MGEVWRRKHGALVRPAAIKLMRPRTLDDGRQSTSVQLTQRFQQEAQATAMLKSPHTVAVYDFGETSDGVLYYVMDFSTGLGPREARPDFGPQPPSASSISCVRGHRR